MFNFLSWLFEEEQLKKPVVMAFARMNPPTSGHEKLVDTVHKLAKKHNAHHEVILSHSHDPKKNPLPTDEKVKHAKRAFPGTNITSSSKESPSFLHHAKRMSDAGHDHLIMVGGSDRIHEYKKKLDEYNGKEGHHNFKKITVVSAGHRDPDAEGTAGMSASKMREHAAAGRKEEFHKGVSSKMSKEHAEEMYHSVRKHMGVK